MLSLLIYVYTKSNTQVAVNNIKCEMLHRPRKYFFSWSKKKTKQKKGEVYTTKTPIPSSIYHPWPSHVDLHRQREDGIPEI